MQCSSGGKKKSKLIFGKAVKYAIEIWSKHPQFPLKQSKISCNIKATVHYCSDVVNNVKLVNVVNNNSC